MTTNNNIPNRLAQEKSPYLLQHQYNPVNWFPWSDEAFETANRENKPIFLSIGYSTCHWCHIRRIPKLLFLYIRLFNRGVAFDGTPQFYYGTKGFSYPMSNNDRKKAV
jgi:hypothetical protein